MPSRPSLHFVKSSSPYRSSCVGHDEDVLATRPNSSRSHVEESPVSPIKPSNRRTSFNMHAILHPTKEHQSRHSESSDREEPRSHRNPLATTLRSSSKSKDSKAKQTLQPTTLGPAKFHMIIESPPLVFYGSSATSTGALLSGRVRLDVTQPHREVKLTKLVMTLNAAIVTKKPVAKECSPCAKRINQLNVWNFLSEPRTFLSNEDHQFPFSFLLPGHLPASTDSMIGSVDYFLQLHAETYYGDEINLIRSLKVERATPPGPDKSAVRIFPPTNLAARLTLPPFIHPIGVFPLQLILSGILNKGAEAQTRWRLRKLTWRIEEHMTIISAACSSHAHKVGGGGKAIQHVEEKVVGGNELKSGWKTDFDTQGGEISLEFDAQLTLSKLPVCDMESPAGLSIKHNLTVELIIAEEFCPNKNTSLITPTGSARVLRMQFAIVVTQRAGMGISWDEEMPPVYTDVPASPPGYGASNRNDCSFGAATMEDYTGPELEYVDLEMMRSDNPRDPPVYRERDPIEYAGVVPATRRDSVPDPEAARSVESHRVVATTSQQGHEWSRSYHASPPPVQRSGFTEDDFEIEPPEHLTRMQRHHEDEGQQRSEEDFALGEAS